MDDIHVCTCQSKRIHAIGLQLSDEVLVDQTSIYHRNHFEHVGICDATAIHHFTLDAEGGCYLCGTATATMYQDLLARDGSEVF